MSDQINSIISKAVAWRMAVLWFVLFSLNALGSSVIAALTGAQWSELDGQSKFMICLAVFVNWSGTVMAFFKSAAKKIESGQLPFDDTTTTTKPSP